jgi:hypothetical protein
MPDWVTDRPPNICAASWAVALPVLDTYLQTQPRAKAQILHKKNKNRKDRLLLEEGD